ncbi:MAG TPA: hypothetical protein VHZ95_17370, partial [Polyangiales bacterium]|nr:hypothetical protein [Polyangiales bacterium]
MKWFPIPPVRTTDMAIADRPAVLVEPLHETHPGTILYFHGGSFALGSPQTAMVVTASLVIRT